MGWGDISEAKYAWNSFSSMDEWLSHSLMSLNGFPLKATSTPLCSYVLFLWRQQHFHAFVCNIENVTEMTDTLLTVVEQGSV